MTKVRFGLALASLVCVSQSPAVSFDDIQFWIGSGTNRAALVVEWSAPESFGTSTVPAPIANKSLVWGCRFNGTLSGVQMFNTIVAGDPRFYAVESIHAIYGTSILGLGFHLNGGADLGITDGTATYAFTNGLLVATTLDVDAAAPLNAGDLFWSGWSGPNWESWTEAGAAGGFQTLPERGANPYWTSTDPDYSSTGYHGQWDYSWGLNSMTITNGSWVGLTVAAGAYDFEASAPYNAHKHAPAEPDPSLTALVKQFVGQLQSGQWQAQFTSCTNWVYALERSADLQQWTAAVTNVAGTGGQLVITDPASPAGQAFYRIRAEKP